MKKLPKKKNRRVKKAKRPKQLTRGERIFWKGAIKRAEADFASLGKSDGDPGYIPSRDSWRD